MAVSSRKSSDANDFSMEEKIVALYELQKIDSKIDEINKLKGELPLEVQDLEDEIAGLDTRIANITAEVDELNKATKQYKDAIDQSKTLIAKYEGQQDNVRNNREFDALSKEIEYQKLEIELSEKRIKEAGVDVKLKKKAIEDAQEVLAERKVDLEAKQKELEWIGAYDITADELLAGTDTAKTESKTAQAQMLILELLADGKRMPSAELEKAVNERGISSRTMRTAKSRIGDRLVTEKDGTVWVCYLRD